MRCPLMRTATALRPIIGLARVLIHPSERLERFSIGGIQEQSSFGRALRKTSASPHPKYPSAIRMAPRRSSAARNPPDCAGFIDDAAQVSRFLVALVQKRELQCRSRIIPGHANDKVTHEEYCVPPGSAVEPGRSALRIFLAPTGHDVEGRLPAVGFTRSV